ncbi:MAG TPA: Ig-like domain repeat protein, partial [Terriglobales bacterium]
YTTLGIAAADFNGDKLPDIAVVNSTGATTANVGVILNTSSGGTVNFGSPAVLALSAAGTTITAGTLKSGQNLAVPLYSAAAPVVATFLNNGHGVFGAESDVSLTNGATSYFNPYAVAIGDLNGDGIPDLAVSIQDATNFNQGIAVLLGAANGTFGAPTLWDSTLQDPNVDNPSPASVVIADMNGDGIPDLAYTNSQFGTAGILYGQGGGAFFNPLEFPASRWAYNLVVAPFSGAGSQDVFVAGWGQKADFSGVTVLLNTGDTGTTLTSSGSPSGDGEPVTFTATVATKTKGTAGPPTGVVKFFNGVTELGAASVISGTARFTTTALAIGTHTITAAYQGNGGVSFLPSASKAVTQVVTKATSVTTIKSSANPQTPGKAVIFTATVTASQPGDTIVPTGTVQFFNGSTSLGTATLNSSGQASVTAPSLTTGSHTITATYSGDTNYTASTSQPFDQVIGKAASTTTVTSSANPAAPKQAVTFTATVASAVAGATVVPTGSVTFNDGTVELGTGTLNSGKATLTTSSLAIGTHSITAVYGGDTDFDTSVSPPLKQVIAGTGPEFGLSASPTSATVNPGSSATYKITVSPLNGFNAAVSFSCPASLPSGVSCSFSPTSSPTGTTLTIATTAPTSAMATPSETNKRGNTILLASLGSLGLVGLVLTGDWKKRKLSGRVVIMAVIALVMIMAFSGCGGGSSSGGGGGPTGGTPAGTYTVSVGGTANVGNVGLANTVNVTLIVQ